MESKSEIHKTILSNVLCGLLQEDFKRVVFDSPLSFSICFSRRPVRKYYICISVINTLVAFGLAEIVKHSFVDGYHFYHLHVK